ncbi:MAG: Fructose ABC transporter, substrate-binding component FrcB [uncultured Quadrisphaera sp.]|uniref:Fructose ABC transporter, substrate-binding component FrcB n=1 Tax=uncultured Quadrisphaera sp. TaxID=904978 RepID=A0A6J4PBN4_9ACTN|nr:MAG: Fructose ABC transporter, substrate-binding component FrcB [uncultured Quadrisphaera sp.]
MLTTHRRRTAAASLVVAGGLALTGCGGSSTGSSGSGGGDGEQPAVTLITKTSTNPFFVAMEEGAKEAAEQNGITLDTAAGREDGDEATQIAAVENAVSQGQDGILIVPNGPGVNTAIEAAREAGLYVIALDTPPDPAETVDITFATDNFEAGELIGQWAAAQLGGEKATIALLDLFNDKVVSVDYNRDQGFLTGMGIDVADPMRNGDEAPTGQYSGGEYEIVCNEPTTGAEDGGRTAMENCLSQNPDINVVYTINEPAALGADAALKAAGTEALIVSVDGGCAGVEAVASGVIGATAQQYPLEMAKLGVEAIAQFAEDGTTPDTSPGLDFFNTGVALVTDTPAEGVESITTDEGSEICWG